METKLVSVVDDVKAWFKKVFKNAPSDEVAALTALNTVAPEAELLLDLIDPAAGAIATPIITEVQADLGTIANLLKNGNTATIGTFVTAIKNNLGTLLAEGHITNAANVAKANGIVSALSGVLTSIANQYPATA